MVIKRYLMNQNYDASIRETERYHIASNTWTILPSNANLPQARWAIFSFVSLTENIIYLSSNANLPQARWAIFSFVSLTENIIYLSSNANLPQARWAIFSFVSLTENIIYLYGGFRIDSTVNYPSQLLDSKVMVVFDGLSNTIAVNNVCPYEIGIAVGSQDFANNYKQLENVIQLLRFIRGVLMYRWFMCGRIS
eukprot:97827_1